MDKEEIKIKEFDKEQLELLLKDLQDIDKFTGFKDGAFKYELGKYQANLLIDYIKKQKEVIDKVKEFIYIVQNNKENKHLEPVLSVDDLDEILDILNEVSE